jgi:hypothetical protein
VVAVSVARAVAELAVVAAGSGVSPAGKSLARRGRG